MKRMIRLGTALLLSLTVTATATAASVPAVAAAAHSVELTFSGSFDFYGNRPILEQYVCNDANTVKLLNGRTLYRYDTASDSFEVEFTFPQQQDINPAAPAGTYRLYTGVKSAYINENTGMLYYAFDKYQKINSTPANMVVQVVTYDLEAGGLVSVHEYPGENLSAVGADNSGNVFLAVRRLFAEMNNETALYVINQNGEKLAKTLTDDPVDAFCGDAGNGRFYVAESVYTPEGDNSYSISRLLCSGSYDSGTGALTVGGTPITYVDPRYNHPAATEGGYLTTYHTYLYHTADDALFAHYPGVPTVGGDYYNRFCTPNTVIGDGLAYTLQNSRQIVCNHMDDGTIASTYQADRDIVSIKRCGNDLLALTKDGTQYSYVTVLTDAFSAVASRTVNLNELSVYQRTQADIVARFAQSVPQDYSAPFFAEEGSVQAPYRAYTLTEEAKENAVKAANYYRWLEGLTELTAAEDTVWDNAAKGAVLTEKNVRLTGELSHYPDKPEDMDDAFYQAGYAATTSGNLGFGYGNDQRALLSLLRGFLNDEGYRIPGHRDTFMTRNGVAFAAGYSEYAGVNIIPFVGSPNPQGTSAVGNDQPAYAWPTPGFFPQEEISTSSVWTVNLNTDAVGLSRKPFTVTITDLTTGEQFVRDSADTGLYTTESWGKYISFLPPEADSYSGKRYKVEVFNLADSNNASVTLEYTVNFFSYADETEIDGRRYTADRYGNLSPVMPDYIRGDVDGDGSVTISDVTEIQRYIAELRQLDDRAFLAADVNGDGDVTVTDATLVQRYLAEFIREL